MSTHGHDAVRKICENWATMSLEEFRDVMAEDCDYRNIPLEGDRHIGPDAAHAILSTMGRKWDIDLTIVNVVGDDHVVMTERTEHFARRDGSREPFALHRQRRLANIEWRGATRREAPGDGPEWPFS